MSYLKIKITADSTCDLSHDLLEKYDIEIIPLYVNIGDKTLRDGIEIDAEQLYHWVDVEKLPASTSAVNVQDYLDVFGRLLRECDAIVHFTISGEFSCCYQNACLAAETLGNVYVVDSRNLSTGIGHLVLDAAEMAHSGADAVAIKTELDCRKEKLDVSFVLETLEYLRRGGRCSSIAAIGANILKLRPAIQVRNGKMSVGKKYRGPMDKCYEEYIRDALSEPETIDTRRIFVTDSGLSEDTRRHLREFVQSLLPFEKIYSTQAGCTISGHCGPGCMGVLFYRK